MLIVLVLMYFLLACFAAWLLLFPGGRELVLQSMANLGLRVQRRAGHWHRGGAGRAGALGCAAQSTLARAWQALARHRWVALAAVLLLGLPPLLAWLASGGSMLGSYDGGSRVANVQLSDLLMGEQLVPPPAPPPLVFTTLEVTQLRPLLGGASRNWQLLDQHFGQRLLLVFKIMRDRYGYEMALLEGYRSPARQNMLAAAGPSVSNAKAFQSYHQYGLAADCAFFRDGKLLISEKDPWAMRGYRLYGEVAESLGLHWGGRWTMMDFGHTELRQPGVLGK
ncbi:M15 family metallopeptidase [Janthinobacterium fluminis]|uniref:M15 family metallopeptidase n=1 Tax=Janthinobacterium fluminis TaxID=2987524 RepID=A0ABT5JVA6_9BURK|nr:M15 family metallopeptidase [Janthinobacterium fluminis]MDC8755996.1 M15 family metallopeptidase [Janthinobacterium fluminis]